jgi:hypothetical protein
MAIEIVQNCRCEACVAVDPNGRQHVFADGHIVDTGPIKGPVMLPDGTVVDVTPQFVEAESAEQAAEIAHAIGKHWEKHGHPDDFDIDEETGDRIQRKFAYDDSHHRKHGRRRAGRKG